MSDLARLTKTDEAVLEERLKTLSFLEVNQVGKSVSFVSEPSRRYASTRLSHLQQDVNDVVIQDLLDRHDQDSVTTLLPAYLHRAGRYDELLHFLTPEYFQRTLQHSQSLAPVKQQVDLGVKASLALNRDGELVRFSIHKSALTQLEGTDVWKAEIEARIALDDFNTAYALANSAGLKEDRLHLLSVIAKAKVKRGLTPDRELIESIKDLYGQIDRKYLGKRALEIAADLVYAAPALAVELVEDSSSANTDDADVAMASLALMARRTEHLEGDEDPGKEIRARIRSPELKTFIDEASIRIRDTSAREILAQLSQIDPVKKLFFLRRWATHNRRREDAPEVMEAALSLAIKATEYTPNARDMRQLSSPLPFVEDRTRLQHLVEMFAANKGNVQRYGPTVDYIRFLLHLASGEFRHDQVRGRDWFEEAYLTTYEVRDLAIRAECYARLLVELDSADPEHHLESSDQIHSLAEAGLKDTVDELRNASALHDVVFSGIIRALSMNRVDLSVAIASSLNTEPRRDRALVEVLDAAMSTEKPPGGLSKIREVIDKIVNPEDQDEALYKVLDRARRTREIPEAWGDEALELFEPIQGVVDPEVRCRCLSRLYVVIATTAAIRHEQFLVAIFEKLISSLEAIDIGWEKVRAAFEASAFVAPHSADRARSLLALAETAKQTALLQTEGAAGAYVGTILLALAAFVGLLPRQLTDENDLRRIGALIDRIPSDGERAQMWAEIALRAHAARQRDLCEKVVSAHVRPLLHNLRNESPASASTMVAQVAPALYCAHLVTAKEDFKTLPAHLRDRAYYNTCMYLFRRCGRFEPFETVANQGYDVGYEHAIELCDLVECIARDDIAFTVLVCLINSLSETRHRNRLTRDQVETLVAKVQAIANHKFPNPRHITHNGYLICTQALIERLKRSGGQVWDTLAADARAIPNLSDRVFVLCTIADACLSKERAKSRQLLVEAHEIAQTIPCVYDRVARTNMVAKQTWEVDTKLAKKLLEAEMKTTIDDGGNEFWPIQRDALDFAYRVDPDWAARLVSMADSDPARIQTRMSLRKHLDVLKTAKCLSDQPRRGQSEEQVRYAYPQAARRLLGMLNAGRIAPRHQEEIREYVEIAADMPFSQAYPILAWVIGNAVKRFADTDQSRTILRPMFEATLLAGQMVARMADQNNRMRRDQWVAGETRLAVGDGGLIRAGERELGISRIRQWIEGKVKEELLICDPFFGPEDLDILRLVLEIKPTTRVRILTSAKHQMQVHVAKPYQETYITHWRTKVSDQEPPDTQVVIVGTHHKKESPIHDRWWLTAGSGLRIGTSFRSLGIEKDAELSELPLDSVLVFEAEVNRYLKQEAREHKGEKLSYSMFTLD